MTFQFHFQEIESFSLALAGKNRIDEETLKKRGESVVLATNLSKVTEETGQRAKSQLGLKSWITRQW